MKILSVMAHKGGVGKTTLTTNLALAAIDDGLSVAVLDLDPQASAEFWFDQRLTNDDRSLGDPSFVSGKIVRLEQTLSSLKVQGADLVVIDTPPRMDDGAQAVAAQSDFILVPTRPSALDTHANIDNINSADRLEKPACVVLNGVPASGYSGQKFADTIQRELNFPVAPEFIVQRVAFERAISTGLCVMEYEPHGKAAQEIAALWGWIKPYLAFPITTKDKDNAS